MLTTNDPVVAVEATAAERSVQLVPSADPCNLKVLVAGFDNAQVVRSIVTPTILVGAPAVSLNISKPTQFKAPLKAE